MKRLVCIILALMLVLTGCRDVAKSEESTTPYFLKAYKSAKPISTDWEDRYNEEVAEHYAKGELIEPVQRKSWIYYEVRKGCVEYQVDIYTSSKTITYIGYSNEYNDIVANTKDEFIAKFKELSDQCIKCLVLTNAGYACAVNTNIRPATYDDNITVDIVHSDDNNLTNVIDYIISFNGVDTSFYGTLELNSAFFITYEDLAEAYFADRGIDINPPEIIGTVSKTDTIVEEPLVEEEIVNDTVVEEPVNVANDAEPGDGVIDTPPDENSNVYHDDSYGVDYYYDGTTLEVYHELMGYSGTENLYAMQNLPLSYYNHSTDAYGRDLIYTSQDAYAVQSMIDGRISEIVWAIDPCGNLCEKVSISNADGTIEYYVYALDCKYNVGYDLSKGDIFAAAGIVEFQYYSFNGNYTAQTILEEFYK